MILGSNRATDKEEVCLWCGGNMRYSGTYTLYGVPYIECIPCDKKKTWGKGGGTSLLDIIVNKVIHKKKKFKQSP